MLPWSTEQQFISTTGSKLVCPIPMGFLPETAPSGLAQECARRIGSGLVSNQIRKKGNFFATFQALAGMSYPFDPRFR